MTPRTMAPRTVGTFSPCLAGVLAIGFPTGPLALARSNLTITAAVIGFCIALGALRELIRERSGPRRESPPPRLDSPNSGRLRIVHVLSHTDATRGGAIQALSLAREQRRAGHDVLVIANNRTNKKSIHSTFHAWISDQLPFRFIAMGASQRVMLAPRSVLRLRRMLLEWNPDVVHVHRDRALLYTLAASIGMKRWVLISQRGTTRRFRHWLIARAHRSRRLAQIIAVAQAVKESLVEQGVDSEKVRVIYGSIDVDRFNPDRVDGRSVRAELKVRDGTLVVAALGELNPRKDPETYIEAFARVMKGRDDVLFIHAGDAKTDRREIFTRLGEERCGDRLRFLGWRADVPALLAAADVVVNTSVADEGLTGVVREALAMGRAVICTRTDGNPELVVDGVTGILVLPRNPDLLAARILELLANPALRSRLGAAGRARVLASMTLQIRAQQVELAYRNALARFVSAKLQSA